MLKLELDWASDSTPDARMDEVGWDDDAVLVEYDEKPGPANWPTVRVYVRELAGEPAHRAYMRLDAWLRDVYGCDEDDAQDLGPLAENV